MGDLLHVRRPYDVWALSRGNAYRIEGYDRDNRREPGVLRVKAQSAKTSASMGSKEAVAVLASLAQETRLAIFRHLVIAGDDGDTAGAIATALDVPGPTLSFHLKELERASIISSRRESRQIYYKANYAGMRGLIDFLTEDCCGGRPEVCFGSKRRRR